MVSKLSFPDPGAIFHWLNWSSWICANHFAGRKLRRVTGKGTGIGSWDGSSWMEDRIWQTPPSPIPAPPVPEPICLLPAPKHPLPTPFHLPPTAQCWTYWHALSQCRLFCWWHWPPHGCNILYSTFVTVCMPVSPLGATLRLSCYTGDSLKANRSCLHMMERVACIYWNVFLV